jgi:hypothetical protein
MKIFNDWHLFKAIEQGDLGAVTKWLDKEANINARNREGNTPLIHAILCKRKDLIRALIDRGADVNERGTNNRSPLHHTAEMDEWDDIAELLIAKGASLDAGPGGGQTPLHRSVINTNLKMAELLILKGSDITARDEIGWTPLHYSVWRSRLDGSGMSELLLAHGARVDARDKKGETPLSMCPPQSRLAGILRKFAPEGAMRLDGILIVFAKEFTPKDVFINSILTKMIAHGRTYQDWMNTKTPKRILINPKAQDPMTMLANAAVQFRMMGIPYRSENVEHATFEGSQGIVGSIITHWSK